MAEYLMEYFDAVERIMKNRKLSLFLDHDGTLAPIAKRPEKAKLPPALKGLLKKLKKCYPVVAISGRSLQDIKKRVGIRGIAYAGNHGMEIWLKDFSMKIKNAVHFKETIKDITEKLEYVIGSVKGVVVENKGLTASIHYRMADRGEIECILKVVKETALSYAFVITKGKKVVEVRPDVSWNKGKAVLWLIRQNGFRGTMPIYIGDDKTDEDAFAALKRKGLSISVGQRLKGADYFLKSQGEVKKLLEQMTTKSS